MNTADKRKLFQSLGKLGGKARAAKLTKSQRVASAKKAAAARWSKARRVSAETRRTASGDMG